MDLRRRASPPFASGQLGGLALTSFPRNSTFLVRYSRFQRTDGQEQWELIPRQNGQLSASWPSDSLPFEELCFLACQPGQQAAITGRWSGGDDGGFGRRFAWRWRIR